MFFIRQLRWYSAAPDIAERANKGEAGMRGKIAICLLAFGLSGAPGVFAGDIKVLTAGAFKSIVTAVVPDFEQQTRHKVSIESGTAGELAKRIENGDAFDVVIAPPAVVDDLIKKGKVIDGSRRNLGRVGIGVMVKDGMPKPDVSTVEAFKDALLAARSIAYIDPASGGSSGVYLTRLFEKLGIAAEVKPKAKLKQGGYVGELIVKGEAELGIHQISEILAVKGVTLIGPLPAEIQNYTVYAGGLGAAASDATAARDLLILLSSVRARAILKEKGMEGP
jgi:molybdate transport system substrate-binding protein